MSTLVPRSIVVRDGQRDIKTKQRTDQSLQNLKRTEEMRGREDWQIGIQG